MFSTALACAWLSTAVGGDRIELDSPDHQELRAVGFELSRPARVEVDATGLSGDTDGGGWGSWFHDQGLLVTAWLLDGETRRPVWSLTRASADRLDSSARLWRETETLELDAGRYELYLHSRVDPSRQRQSGDEEEDKSWWDKMWSRDAGPVRRLETDLADCRVHLSFLDDAGRVARYEVTGDLPGALLRLNRMADQQLATQAFQISEPVRLRAYALTEGRDEPSSDYGWIVDSRTRRRVWDTHAGFDDPAGGASRNRLVDDRFRLEPGTYVAYYGTDDSHSFERFNSDPPWDPYNWGLTLLAAEDLPEGAFRRLPDLPEPPLLTEFLRAGDGAFHEQPFRLEQPTSLWIRASGEYGERNDEFYDGAWIVDARSGRKAWEMTRSNTDGAGGASKNRAFDGLVPLDPGEYILYYISDGSHSYTGWNGAMPFDAMAWGVEVRAAPGETGAGFAKLSPKLLDEIGDWLVRLVRIGDDEHRVGEFRLDSEAALEVRALGEGDRGSMYDYAYIVDAESGRRVWEMSWDRTHGAGGARKNRNLRETVTLAAGSYQAVYVSDDSHSFDGWNAAPPNNPLDYGLTIRRAD